MKKLNRILIVFSALAITLTSCTGPAGEDGLNGFDGFDGIDGRDGDAANETVIYELGGLTFNDDNGYVINEVIPNDIIIDETDIIIVYRLLAIDTVVGDIWEPLPQMYFFDEGILQYTFNFSSDDIDFILDSDFDLSTFENATYTDDQIFRIAVIPASDNTSAKVLTSDNTYSQIAKDAVVIKL